MAKKQRVPHDVLHRQAQLEVLGAMVRGEDLDGLTAAVAPSEVPNWFNPGCGRPGAGGHGSRARDPGWDGPAGL